MRTTVTLDDDVVQQLRELQHRSRSSFKHVVNETLRAGLRGATKPRPLTRFRVTPKAAGFRTGVDVLGLNQLNDALESERFRRGLAPSRAKR